MSTRGWRKVTAALVFTLLLLAGLAGPAFAANIIVPTLELLTWGRLEGGVFGFDTQGP
jgi:hypothetical protein